MQVTLEVKDQVIINALEAAQIAYWGDFNAGWNLPHLPGESPIGNMERAYSELMIGKREIMVEEFNEGEGTTVMHKLTATGIREALVIIADKWPWHFKDIIGDSGDAETGDVLIQVALFKDIIYG